MLTIIAKIILCMLAAALLGFVIGWIFSSLLRNEKHQRQILAVREKFDEQKAEINQLETKLDAKDREMLILKEEHTTMQREMLSSNMDRDDTLMESKINDLQEENLLLLTQIKEQKLCEDSIEKLKKERQSLYEKVEELQEFKASYKENIHRIAELESSQTKKSNKDLEKNIFFKSTQSHEDKIEKQEEKSPKSSQINDKICKNSTIIDKKELDDAGLKNEKISDTIKDIFKKDD